ncbi:MAG: tyrosine-type recombinase/integrase [Pseudoxanthomonas sp.]
MNHSRHDNRVHITDEFCRTAEARPGRAMTVYTDTKLSGFCLVVTAAGAKTFAARYTLKDGDEIGKQARISLGPYLGRDGFSVLQARNKAKAVIGDASQGIDKAAKKRAARKAMTVAALCDRYLKEHAPKKRSGDQDERRIDKYILPAWSALKAVNVTRADVATLLAPIEHGDPENDRAPAPYEAMALLRLIKKLFNFGIDREAVATNPAARMKLATEPEARERSLDRAEELRAFWALTEGDTYMPAAYSAALRVQLLTGARPGEVIGMAWDELDLEADEWTLPKARSKNKREHLLPLTPALRAILDQQAARWTQEQAAREATGKPARATRYVFPAQRGGRYTDRCRALMLDAGLHEFTKARHKLARFTPHDLRRTAETVMAAAGVVREHRDRVLNHVDNTVGGKHYNRHDFKAEKLAALETLQRAIDAKLADNPDNVTDATARFKKSGATR